jgi:SAM-dependent methyltransferase
MTDLSSIFGPIDIYLFDQILRGRIRPGMKVLDAGCGSGRNLIYLLREGYDVYGADADEHAISLLRRSVAELAPELPAENFRGDRIDALTFPDAFADAVISNAVLHFARDDADFEAMLRGSWGALKAGGLFFCRLASSIGMESRMRRIDGRRYSLPDGSDRYLVDEALLLEWTAKLDAELVDPIKTTVVQDLRCMTTWVLRKR